MINELGHFSLVLATVVAVLQASLPLYGAQTNNLRLMALARPAAVWQFLLILLSFMALTQAFVTSDFSLAVVANNSHSAKPMLYKVTGVWGNHEGSMLLWVLILACFGAAVAVFGGNLPAGLRSRVLSVQALIGLGFLVFILLTSNPFDRILPPPLDGRDLNPLLQDPGLAFHPPFLYLGYVGFSMAFAFAVAALIEGRVLNEMETVCELAKHAASLDPEHGDGGGWLEELAASLDDPATWATLVSWVAARHLGEVGGLEGQVARAIDRFRAWHLRSAVIDHVMALGRSEEQGRRTADAVELLIETVGWRDEVSGLEGIGLALERVLSDGRGRRYLRTNEHADVVWFNREAFDELLRWMILVWILDGLVEESEDAPDLFVSAAAVWETLTSAAENSGYRSAQFLEVLGVANQLVTVDQ